MRQKFGVVAMMVWFSVLAAPAAAPASADGAKRFEPTPLSKPVYGVSAPDDVDALAAQRRYVAGAGDTPLYVETFLPKPLLRKVPVVLIDSPYQGFDFQGGPFAQHIEAMARHWAARGYAVSIAHVRGTSKSGGCVDWGGRLEQQDAVALVEWAGTGAPWANGKVGMYGGSYAGMAQIEAATADSLAVRRHLKAIVPLAPTTGAYAVMGYDGVMDAPALMNPLIMLAYSAPQPDAVKEDDLLDLLNRPDCQDDHLQGPADRSGNFNAWYEEREFRDRAHRIGAATLYVQGLFDRAVYPQAVDGFFDRISADTPHKAVIGQWQHDLPDGSVLDTAAHPRFDWTDMATAWFDRWLKDLPTGAERWPAVQLQDTDGGWRAEPGFPATSGTHRSLALGSPDGTASDAGFGTLGASAPTGSTSYREDSTEGSAIGTPPIGGAVFETPALTEPLHVTGRPELELWLKLEQTEGECDAHVVASLEPLDSGLAPINPTAIQGRRSAQHLEPIVDGRFEQAAPIPPADCDSVHIPVRIEPADFIVPAGGRLRVVVTGIYNYDRTQPSVPSGGHGEVRILHDSAHPSALHFTEADPNAQELIVAR